MADGNNNDKLNAFGHSLREYDIDLCKKMMIASLVRFNKTKDKKASEIIDALRFFFDDDVIDEAKEFKEECDD